MDRQEQLAQEVEEALVPRLHHQARDVGLLGEPIRGLAVCGREVPPNLFSWSWQKVTCEGCLNWLTKSS